MSTASTEGLLNNESETEEQEGLERLRQLVRALVDHVPGLRDELVGEARDEARDESLALLVSLFALRLGRRPSDEEHGALRARLRALGPARLGEVVSGLAPEALAAWLADPAAT